MALNRRDFITAGGAALACGVSGLRAAAPSDTDAEATAVLAEAAEQLLVDYPESATTLGLDNGARVQLKARLADRSPAGQDTLRRRAVARLAKLRTLDTSKLNPSLAIDVDVTRTAHETAVSGAQFPFGDVVVLNQQLSYRNCPYVVTQNTGAFIETPDFLDSNHVINNAADAHAYIQRLARYADSLDGETARLASNRSEGMVAPDFLLDKTLQQMRSARSMPIEQWSVVTSIVRRSAKLSGDFSAQAVHAVQTAIRPALTRQIEELEVHRARATNAAGIGGRRWGEAYYAWALQAATTTRLMPAEVHASGLDQLKDLQAKMEVILRSLGLTQGTVGERMTALGKDPRYLFANTDAGRQQILDYIAGRIVDIRARLPRAFATLVPGNLVVKRVPPAIELGAPGGYASAGTLDGSVPGMYYINLRDTQVWPKYGLPTLTYHEGIPGHVWQGEYVYRLPLIRSLLAFNAYSEGWALYAEQLADELGVYESDPLGRLGYLQSIAFRACRLVVDTGLHAKGWSREQAIHWFATTNGSSLQEVESEVDRYCAWPGQACGYKIGHNEINRLRDKTQSALGAKYDLRAFNDTVVKSGGVPLTVLERIVNAFVAQQKAG